MKFIVDYSIERDVYNYLNSVWRMKYKTHGRNDLSERLLKRCSKKYQKNIGKTNNEDEAKEITRAYLEQNYHQNKSEFQGKI